MPSETPSIISAIHAASCDETASLLAPAPVADASSAPSAPPPPDEEEVAAQPTRM